MLRRPLIYQEVDGVRQPVKGRYVFKGKGQVGFKVGAYDATRPLAIDPVLLYATYLGGSGSDQGHAIAVDSAGNAYVTGRTSSTAFPTTGGAFDQTLGGSGDVFVTKLNAAGSALVYSTFLGGTSSDIGLGIAVDSSGNAYITGRTDSTNFPTTSGAFDTTHNSIPTLSNSDAFVTKLNADGSGLVYSTFLGGSTTVFASGSDEGHGIAVDSSGNAYITGVTNSTDFPTTSGSFDRTLNNGDNTSSPAFDAFVTKLNAAGSGLVYSTYLGGTSHEFGNGIAVDSSGNAYVTGRTFGSTFPTTSNAFQTTAGGSNDIFVSKLNASGSALLYSTFLGGSGSDEGKGIAVDSSGNTYVIGHTSCANFPRTSGAFVSAPDSTFIDISVSKLNPSASGSASLVYSACIGGNGQDEGFGIAVDASGNAYVTGFESSSDFPLVDALPASPFLDGAFVAKLNTAGSALIYSTHVRDATDGQAIAVDSSGNAYITGRSVTASSFFATSGAFDTTHNGSNDSFVAKIGAPPPVNIAVNETISVTDAPQVLLTLVITVNETISVTDAPQVVLPVVITVNESISVTDAPSFPLGGTATITGTVTLQGRTATFPAGVGHSIATVTMSPGNVTANVAMDGTFQFSGVSAGTVTFTASASGYLSAQRADVQVGSSAVVLPAVQLLMGLVNGDTAVTGIDLSAVVQAFGSSPPNRMDAQGNIVDQNGDGGVTGLDLSGTVSNFGRASPTSWP